MRKSLGIVSLKIQCMQARVRKLKINTWVTLAVDDLEVVGTKYKTYHMGQFSMSKFLQLALTGFR
jgi:hypothetical protein